MIQNDKNDQMVRLWTGMIKISIQKMKQTALAKHDLKIRIIQKLVKWQRR